MTQVRTPPPLKKGSVPFFKGGGVLALQCYNISIPHRSTEFLMDSRDRKNDFVTYLQAVGEKLGVKYSDADLYSSSKFLLMTTSDISQRFFDVKYSSYSFFQEDKKNAKREDEYTYSIPILSSDPVKNLSTAHRLVERQVVASANEVVNESRIQNILDDLDKDLIARPDWKQFWEEMEKQAPEKKSDIVKMQQYILNSYRFRAISMMAANLMSDVRGNITEEAKVNRLTLLLQKESGNRMRKMRSDSVPSKSAASSAEKTSSASILQVMAEKTGTAPAALVAASTRSQKLLAIEEMMLELEHKQNEKINTDRKGELEPIIAAQQSLAAYDRNMINSMFNAVMTIRQNYEKPQHKQGSKYAKRLQSLDKLENQCFDIVSK